MLSASKYLLLICNEEKTFRLRAFLSDSYTAKTTLTVVCFICFRFNCFASVFTVSFQHCGLSTKYVAVPISTDKDLVVLPFHMALVALLAINMRL